MAKISYTARDRAWAEWIGVTLRDNGHEPLIHEWEIGAGQNIPQWMNQSLEAADCLLGVFTDAYTAAIYSGAERNAAFWQDPEGCKRFLVPVEVEEVTAWPLLVSPLKRLSLVGLAEVDAETALLAFLEPPKAPDTRPPFPGKIYADRGVLFDEMEQTDALMGHSQPLPAVRPPLPGSPTSFRVDYDNSPEVTASGRITMHHEVAKGSERRAAKGFFLQLDTPLSLWDGEVCYKCGKIVLISDDPQLVEWVNRHVTIEGKLGRFGSALVDPSIFIEVATIKDSVD